VVWELFKRFTAEAFLSGLKSYSADAICHRIRWHSDVEVKGDLKLNNNFTAFFARLYMVKFPDRDGFFNLRQRKSCDRVAGKESELLFLSARPADEDPLREELLKL
jgi:hypothetical protein